LLDGARARFLDVDAAVLGVDAPLESPARDVEATWGVDAVESPERFSVTFIVTLATRAGERTRSSETIAPPEAQRGSGENSVHSRARRAARRPVANARWKSRGRGSVLVRFVPRLPDRFARFRLAASASRLLIALRHEAVRAGWAWAS